MKNDNKGVSDKGIEYGHQAEKPWLGGVLLH